MAKQFETPEFDKDFKFLIEGEAAQELFINHSTRNGKYVKDQLMRLIWEKHNLPMYRGTIVDEVPFQLKINQTLFDYRGYKIAVSYQFVGL